MNIHNNQESIAPIIHAMRPSQWTKNAVILAAFLFAFRDPSSQIYGQFSALYTVLPAIVIFCIVSSGIYILNDIKDVESDRNHPQKKFRPIAAGTVSLHLARIISVVLIFTGIASALLLSSAFASLVAGYVILQLLYSFGLKHIALLDVFMIATGFVIRAIAGAVVINVIISPWLLLCTFMLALFLALCKRRHEKVIQSETANEQRISLEKYDKHLLDQLIAIISSSTIISYAMYTLSHDTVEKFGTTWLGFTIPFVAFGIFRYLDLVYRHEKGDRPEKILLTDIPTLINIGLYGFAVLAILAFK